MWPTYLSASTHGQCTRCSLSLTQINPCITFNDVHLQPVVPIGVEVEHVPQGAVSESRTEHRNVVLDKKGIYVQHTHMHTYTCVLSRLFLGVLHLPIAQMYPPISVSEAAAPPHKSDGMHAKPICINSNHYQTATQMHVYSNGMQYNCLKVLHYMTSLL